MGWEQKPFGLPAQAAFGTGLVALGLWLISPASAAGAVEFEARGSAKQVYVTGPTGSRPPS